MDFKIIRMPVGSYQANCYIVFNDENEAIIIDPGAQPFDILKAVEERNLKVSKILLTHAHPDHFGALKEVREKLNVPAYISTKDEVMLEDRSGNLGEMLGIKSETLKADVIFNENDYIDFGNKKIQVILTPGHTPGGACFLLDDILFTGDTLFSGSIGRTDLPGGDYDTIMESLRELMNLPADTVVLPGHGPETTIAQEKINNPFIRSMI